MNEYSEYKCWMQERKAAIPNTIALCLATLCADQDCVFAMDELRSGLSRFAPLAKAAAGKLTFLGTIAHLNAEHGLDLPAQKPEGFVIRVTDVMVIIAGQDKAGLLYGVHRFLMLLAQDKITVGIEAADAPSVPIRMINHWDNCDGTVERGYAGRSLFFDKDRFDYDPQRIIDYARLLSSIGINRLSINNVNVRAAAKLLITEEYLPELAKLAALFRPFNIRLAISINFAAPYLLGELATADPLDPAVAAWWCERTNLIYRYVPDLAGFVVKADSEYEPGPFQYGRGHAEGANMLAAALKPHGGQVWWRCFVYNCTQDWRNTKIDRARAAFDHFKPLDGQFADNVFLQIKHGPYDFQVSEPVSPLFGALSETRCLMEVQITQEYTGHQIDLCFLPWIWTKILHFDTGYGEHSRIEELMGTRIQGLVAVGNVGLDRNWTGHTLAQANLYGFGRLAWNPSLCAAEIAEEWAHLSFGREAAAEIAGILLASYPTYQKYNAPFGVCFMVEPKLHYGPNVEGYEFSRWGTYHRADRQAIGIDRTECGTGYTAQYAPQVAAIFADPALCPEEFLLFFHRVRYDFVMKNGKTLLQNIYDTHFEGCDEVQVFLKRWLALKGSIAESVYESVKARMEKQLENARQWRDVINTYFYRHTGIADQSGRKIYD
ncbi:MAG: alpha-glucuronidase [Spirochaetaceae bacterium]|jgi:alpha-glucuronidase|nr:alpha-glucuronidase [Spirochaetaceae bacterium]